MHSNESRKYKSVTYQSMHKCCVSTYTNLMEKERARAWPHECICYISFRNMKVPQDHGKPEPGHQGARFLWCMDKLWRELEREPLKYHGDPDTGFKHCEVSANAGPRSLREGQQGIWVWLAAVLDTPCSNLAGLNSSASWPQTSLSLCSNAIGIDSIVPLGAFMLPSWMPEPAVLRSIL